MNKSYIRIFTNHGVEWNHRYKRPIMLSLRRMLIARHKHPSYFKILLI